MKFHVVQPVSAPREAVVAAVVDPRLYESMHGMQSLGTPSVIEHRVDGDLNLLRIRYAFRGRLSSAARAVLDPAKMTWVVNLEVDMKRYDAEFQMIPDHYTDRIRCAGSYRFEARGDKTDQVMDGELVVNALLVAGAIEKTIVSGFKEHIAEQAKAVERLAAERSDS
ncbi:MAG: DUF2505 family protein [Acidimicrobiales bacterium]